MLETILGQLAAGEDLSMQEVSDAIDAVVSGRCTDEEIALLLVGLRMKGETAAEIAGAAAALRRHMTPIRSRRQGIVDTCGTGGGGSQNFNISTAAALVVAAAGVPVAKHGNRRVTSRSGSADVLEALGVNIQADVSRTEACLDELGICFCFAPLWHPAMQQVAAVRRRLEMPTIFNLLGPLANPAAAPYQVLGVVRSELRATMAEALAMLGTTRSVVVCGRDGLGEVSLGGPTDVTEIGTAPPRNFVWEPADIGIEARPPRELAQLKVENAQQSANIIRSVLAGNAGPARDIVVLNAAAALWVAGHAATPRDCAQSAASAIDQGRAQSLLSQLIARTNA